MGLLAASLSLMMTLQAAVGDIAVRREGDRLVMTRRVMFVRGHVEHVPGSRAVVDAMAKYLRGQSGVEVVVEGHSDIGGDEAENVRLSLARAEFVAQGLRRRGVTVTIRAVGLGSSAPLVAANSPELWRNRRIEVRLVTTTTTTTTTTIDAPPAATPAVALLDEAVPPPLLDDMRAPHVPTVDDDLLPVSFAATPHIALLDDEPHIGLVE